MNLDFSLLIQMLYKHGGTVILAAIGVKLIYTLIDRDRSAKEQLSQMSDIYITYLRQMTEMGNNDNKVELDSINRNLNTIRSTLSEHIMHQSEANMKLSGGIDDILEDKEEDIEDVTDCINDIKEVLMLLRIQLDTVSDLVIKSSYDDSITNELIRTGTVSKQDVHGAVEAIKKKRQGA